MPTKKELLDRPIQHLDIKQHNVVPLVDAMHHMAYSARDTARAANIYDMMLRDTDCGVILCLAGSLISAGLQKIFIDLVRRAEESSDEFNNRRAGLESAIGQVRSENVAVVLTERAPVGVA